MGKQDARAATRQKNSRSLAGGTSICLGGSRKDQGCAATNGKAKSRLFNETTRPTYKHVEQIFHAGLAGDLRISRI